MEAAFGKHEYGGWVRLREETTGKVFQASNKKIATGAVARPYENGSAIILLQLYTMLAVML